MGRITHSSDLEDGYKEPVNVVAKNALPGTIKIAATCYLISQIWALVIFWYEFRLPLSDLFSISGIQIHLGWIIPTIITYGLSILTGIMIIKGKVWPRIVLTILFTSFWLIYYSYFRVTYFSELFDYSIFIISILHLGTLILLYMPKSNNWYKQARLAYIEKISKRKV